MTLRLWAHVIATGALGVGIPESIGGGGGGLLELALIAEEAGRRGRPHSLRRAGRGHPPAGRLRLASASRPGTRGSPHRLPRHSSRPRGTTAADRWGHCRRRARAAGRSGCCRAPAARRTAHLQHGIPTVGPLVRSGRGGSLGGGRSGPCTVFGRSRRGTHPPRRSTGRVGRRGDRDRCCVRPPTGGVRRSDRDLSGCRAPPGGRFGSQGRHATPDLEGVLGARRAPPHWAGARLYGVRLRCRDGVRGHAAQSPPSWRLWLHGRV